MTALQSKLLLWLNALLQFLSRLLKSIWLFFPGILFLLFFIWCFWSLGQGKDIIVAFTENGKAKVFFFIAISFWIYVSWYSSRIISYQKLFKQQERIKNIGDAYSPELVEKKLGNSFYYDLPVVWLDAFPRLIGFACVLAIELAVLQSPLLGEKAVSPGNAMWIFIAGMLITWKVADILNDITGQYRQTMRIIFYCLFGLFVAAVAVACIMEVKSIYLLFWLLFLLNIVFIFYINLRRRKLEQNQQKGQNPSPGLIKRTIYRIMNFAGVPVREIGYFNYFNLFCLAGLVIYFATIWNIHVSWQIGPFPFVLLAFAVLGGFGNIITLFSVKTGVNFHFILFLAALLLGSSETHYLRTKTLAQGTADAQNNKRPDINTYFKTWIDERGAEIDQSDTFPIYFVLANGGASRSGYWTASVLGKLEDTTKGKASQLSKHLFCLSGTSGGGVGVATFFSLLYERQKLDPTINVSFLSSGKAFLKNDFLTHTLAHMLGPDYFRYIFHISKNSDRAGALEESFELAAQECTGPLKAPFYEPLSSMLPLKNNTKYALPILCINTTRMQDGNPGVVTNIQLDKRIFNNRLDVTGMLLTNSQDINLSTAALLGARFPYVSPAGRIDEWIPLEMRAKKDSIISHYFVDGGYFDNSGAGVVQEMMRAMLSYATSSTDSLFKKRVGKLYFTVLHITNSPLGVAAVEPVTPIKNDLMAPILTITGAYDMQTTVNDSRLINYLNDIKGNNTCKGAEYYPIDLYKTKDEKAEERKRGDTLEEQPYAMNWFISAHTLERMDTRLTTQPALGSLINKLAK